MRIFVFICLCLLFAMPFSFSEVSTSEEEVIDKYLSLPEKPTLQEFEEFSKYLLSKALFDSSARFSYNEEVEMEVLPLLGFGRLQEIVRELQKERNEEGKLDFEVRTIPWQLKEKLLHASTIDLLIKAKFKNGIETNPTVRIAYAYFAYMMFKEYYMTYDAMNPFEIADTKIALEYLETIHNKNDLGSKFESLIDERVKRICVNGNGVNEQIISIRTIAHTTTTPLERIVLLKWMIENIKVTDVMYLPIDDSIAVEGNSALSGVFHRYVKPEVLGYLTSMFSEVDGRHLLNCRSAEDAVLFAFFSPLFSEGILNGTNALKLRESMIIDILSGSVKYLPLGIYPPCFSSS